MAKPNGLVRASSDSFPSQLGRSSETATGPFIGIMDEVMKRYLAGEKITDISTACGVSGKWITTKISVLRRAGFYIPHRRNPRNELRDTNKRAKFVVTADAGIEAIDPLNDTAIDNDFDDGDQRKWKKSNTEQSEDYIASLRQFHSDREINRRVISFSRF